jgi:hypothetical protein
MAVADTTLQPVSQVIQDVPRKKPSLGKKILGLLWDSLDDKSPEEHRLVRRLDSCYLVWACFYYFVMYLDSSMCFLLSSSLL